ncbi:MAG: DUF255 domain-containing protein [Fimbriimonadales bacterium]|nr:DUF255 domain-containing protein [Fimbriimonadales bacterium]
MPNRLASASSPYLRQHQHNPVDWYPWGDEAFERARRENRPVFLSIGYASCHWCHVMAHEVFEDGEVAEALNAGFVSVKVDREELPDVDETYMAALHVGGARGGWPMTLFLTPERKPFFAATYLPKDDRGGYPGFLTIARQIARGWQTQEADYRRAADKFEEAIRAYLSQDGPPSAAALGWPIVLEAVRAILSQADLENGGFGTRPKFPPHTALELLLDVATDERVPADPELREACLAIALMTLEAMALGGIHDHVGGGFHRYSVDESWFLPHFEKMLYDNALLLATYSRAAQLLAGRAPEAEREFRRVADRTARWLLREMRAPSGLFFSAIDADSEGEEGWFYVWSLEEVRSILGASTLAFAASFGLTENGNYQDEATGRTTGRNLLALTEPIASQFDAQLERLLQAREGRVRPMTDTKCLVGWNGLAIRGLAIAGYHAEAAAAAHRLLEEFRKDGALPRMIVEERPEGVGYLEDYAFLAWGLVALAEATREETWRLWAEEVFGSMLDRFGAEGRGLLRATERRHEALFGALRPIFDQPIPSANSVAADVAVQLGDSDLAMRILSETMGWMEKAPHACEGLVRSLVRWLAGRGTPATVAPAAQARPEVRVVLDPCEVRPGADGWGRAVLRFEIPEGMHINSPNPPARWLEPTSIRAEGCLLQVDWPPHSNDRYEGVLEVSLRLRHEALPAEFELTVGYQACTETECLAKAQVRLAGVLLP